MRVRTNYSAPAYAPLPLFDIDEATRLRDEGRQRASTTLYGREKPILEACREACRRAALRRATRTATADDAYRWLGDQGIDLESLGPAAGALFKCEEWRAVGYTQSERTTNHGRVVRLWEYVG